MKTIKFSLNIILCLWGILLSFAPLAWGFKIEEHLWENGGNLTPVGVPGMITTNGSSSSYYVKDDTWRTKMVYHALKLEGGQSAEVEIGSLVPNPAGTGLKIWVASLESLHFGTLSEVTPLPTYINNIAAYSTEMSSGKKTLTITSSSSGSFTIGRITFYSANKTICIIIAATTVGPPETGLCAYSITASVTKSSSPVSDGTVQISFVSDGDTLWKSTYTVGDIYHTLLPTTKTGYTFDGWYSTASFAASSRVTWSNTVSARITTLYAKWSPNRYFVTYDYGGGKAGATNPTLADYDTPFRVSAPTRSGWTFAGWKVTDRLNTSTAKWGTTAEATTPITSSSDRCVNGATGDVFFLNLTPDFGVTTTLTAFWATDTMLPESTKMVTGSIYLTNGILVEWAEASGATSYNVWRGEWGSLLEDAKKIEVDAVSPYLDDSPDLLPDTMYKYWIESVNSVGAIFSTVTGGGKMITAAPGAPTELSATTTLTNGIQVSWTGGSGATSHNVWRGTTTTRSDAKRIKIGATTPYLDEDSALVAGTSYYFWIEATNSAGNKFSTSYATGRKAVLLTLDRSAISATASGGNKSFSVTANTSWSASSGSGWISFTTSSGSGNGTCAFTVEANPDANARTGTVTVVAGKNTDAPKTATVSVVQQAKARFAVGSYELDMGDGLVWLRFPGTKGTTYRVERAKELGGTWATAMTFTATNDGLNEVSASIPGKWDTGFFRVGQGGGDEPENPETSTNAPTGLYLVVDLSGGPDAASWPVSELKAVPSGGWTDEYKTTKLVLRRVEAGKFIMGSPSEELGRDSDETQHEVTISKPFYMGVFEVTQKQWELVTGRNESYYSGDKRPVETVFYEEIRGYSEGTKWPTSNAVDAYSFLGKLRAKTGLAFDLPTEAQWEYACRAGTTTALNSGKDLTDLVQCVNMDEVGRYRYNKSDGKDGDSPHTTVGSYLANAWGLYDMHGNVWEWCRDWYVSDLGTVAVTDPKGASSGLGSGRAFRGGGWGSDACYCSSASRSYIRPTSAGRTSVVGFRLAMILSE